MGDQSRPWLDTILPLLSLHGYSVFSLIDDVLARSNLEHQSITLLKKGLERDAPDICARLLSHNPTSASVSAWALGVAQSTLRSEAEEMARKDHDHPLSEFLGNNIVVSPAFASGTACTGGPEKSSNLGRAECTPIYRHGTTIDVLADNVFLEIFNFCLADNSDNSDRRTSINPLERTRQWQTLVHVCQRWRKVIFASPRRLNLNLICSYGTPVRTNLVFWPVTLPLFVDYRGRIHPIYGFGASPDDEDNIIFALEHARRVHRIEIRGTGPLIRNAAAVMRKSFPALTYLDLTWDLSDFPAPHSRGVPVIPSGFLGGSAPHLHYLRVRHIAFPQVATFLLSARNLVTLKLKDIPQNGYISPEAMVGSLSVLTRLTTLSISFCDETLPSNQRRSPLHPSMRTILPALADFHFLGSSGYFEELLAHIDTPQLDRIAIEYFMQRPIQVPQLSQFINRTENLKLDQFKRAEVSFFFQEFYFELECPQGKRRQPHLSLKILEQAWLDRQVPCLAYVLGQLAPMFSNVDHLSADGDHVDSREMDITEWLPFFRLFPAVESLQLIGGVAAYIASALEDIADPPENLEMVADVFPALHLIWFDEGDEEDEFDDYRHEPVGSIDQFLSLRQLSGRPVTIVNSQDEFVTAIRRKRKRI